MDDSTPMIAVSQGHRLPEIRRSRNRAARRLSLGLIPVCFGLLALGATTIGQPMIDSQAALNEGNRLFREGQIEAAVMTYIEGYSAAAPHPTLLYNLGTALHHLDRLPEAILWYRRAAPSDDPWLEDNLWLARRSLGSQILTTTGTSGWLSRHDHILAVCAIGLSWFVFLLLISRPQTPRWLLIATATFAVILYGAAMASEQWGPQPAVVLNDCTTPAGDLPAGTEAWVRRTTDDRWIISGVDGAICPSEAVELVFPPG